jgi:regulator of sigma E protease
VPQAKDNEAIDLGIQWGRTMVVHPGPWEQVSDAATSIFRMVGALFSSKSDVKVAHFSGPVGIMRLYYQVFESPDGWRRALALSVLINVNLALINLLPFPVLDGGHITLALIEGVRRKPVNQRVLEILQTACAVLLLGFMLYVTVFDVGDIVRDNRADAEAAEKAKAETPPSK